LFGQGQNALFSTLKEATCTSGLLVVTPSEEKQNQKERKRQQSHRENEIRFCVQRENLHVAPPVSDFPYIITPKA
jgi:hypothetical protein